MNKKELSELRRLFTPERCPVTRVCGCYVDSEKEKKATIKEAFLSLQEEEMYKYFEIFKKTMSGTIGKHQMNLEFPLEAEEEGGTQEFLMQLKNSRLTDDALLDRFYDHIIESFPFPENYYIILIHCAYDIPGRGTDGAELFDASDDVYEYLLCSICPVRLTKPGLCYDEDENTITERIRDWFVEPPVCGFLFPAFNERNTDIHSLLYYSKNPDERNADFAEAMLGCTLPLSAASQKESFQSVVSDTLGGECTFEAVKEIHEALNSLLEERKDDPDPVVIDRGDVKRLLQEVAEDPESLDRFEEHYSSATGDAGTTLYVGNIAAATKYEIKTPGISISVKPESADLIETRVIDGRPYLLIPADDSVELNGIPVKVPVPQP